MIRPAYVRSGVDLPAALDIAEAVRILCPVEVEVERGRALFSDS